jgi:hypothetical protein
MPIVRQVWTILASVCVAAALAVAVPQFSGCASGTNPLGSVLLQSPEAEIKTGADAHAAATTLASVLLQNDKISVAQAKSYRVLLGAASTALDTANADLEACRTKTGSTQKSSPDPCRPTVEDVIALALASIQNVQKTLSAK